MINFPGSLSSEATRNALRDQLGEHLGSEEHSVIHHRAEARLTRVVVASDFSKIAQLIVDRVPAEQTSNRLRHERDNQEVSKSQLCENSGKKRHERRAKK